jgi:uncharacterized protein (TIGR00290 family)
MMQAGYQCKTLFTMLDETGIRSRSHGLTPEVLRIQAQAMGIPLTTGMAAWSAYEVQFKKLVSAFKNDKVMNGVFGDIDLQPHRDWVERVCNETGITAHLPLWNEARRTLVEEFIREGFKACIVVVNCSMMSERFLGRVIDQQLIDELEADGIDACGENGEFHTFVFDGPLFRKKIYYTNGEKIKLDNYSYLPIKASIE